MKKSVSTARKLLVELVDQGQLSLNKQQAYYDDHREINGKWFSFTCQSRYVRSSLYTLVIREIQASHLCSERIPDEINVSDSPVDR